MYLVIDLVNLERKEAHFITQNLDYQHKKERGRSGYVLHDLFTTKTKNLLLRAFQLHNCYPV